MTVTAGPWRIGIAGAGAIGTTLAVRLALGRQQVSVLARGDTLAAIQAEGLRLTDLYGSHQVRVAAGSGEELGPQDVVFLCAKGQDLPALARAAAPMFKPGGMIVPLVNGIPWWYFHGLESRHQGRVVRAVDPDGVLAQLIPMDAVVGAVTFITAQRLAPGFAYSANPLRLVVGEISHRHSERTQRLGSLLSSCAIATEVSDHVRDPLWTKVIANLTSNPLSVIAGATLRDIYTDPCLAPLARQMLEEALLTAAAHGARVALDPDALLAMGAAMGSIKTSMLQDYEKGLPLELAPIGDAVIELAGLQGLTMPLTQNILALARYKSAKTIPAPQERTP